ncbi:MAG TPA: IS3 family transposase [Acidimicrobiales bacterium]|nr:IS3 family transposase [Acidimicrobiales bacterium]
MSVASFIASQRAEYGIPHVRCCHILGVSESWFYKWHDRPPTARQRRREALDARVTEIFEDSGGTPRTYGSPRIYDQLKEEGWAVAERSVADSMARQGLVARPKRRFRSLTRPDKAAQPLPDLIKRDFSATRPDEKWCGDLTEIPTDEGKLYLASVLDLAARRIPGFAMGEHHDAELAAGALKMAAAVRGGDVAGVIFHSDKGSEFTADHFSEVCDRLGVTQSAGRVGSCFDNAAVESWHSTLEFECLSRHRFATKAEARRVVARYIDTYNTTRRHSTCQMRSPMAYEAELVEKAPQEERAA